MEHRKIDVRVNVGEAEETKSRRIAKGSRPRLTSHLTGARGNAGKCTAGSIGLLKITSQRLLYGKENHGFLHNPVYDGGDPDSLKWHFYNVSDCTTLRLPSPVWLMKFLRFAEGAGGGFSPLCPTANKEHSTFIIASRF